MADASSRPMDPLPNIWIGKISLLSLSSFCRGDDDDDDDDDVEVEEEDDSSSLPPPALSLTLSLRWILDEEFQRYLCRY